MGMSAEAISDLEHTFSPPLDRELIGAELASGLPSADAFDANQPLGGRVLTIVSENAMLYRGRSVEVDEVECAALGLLIKAHQRKAGAVTLPTFYQAGVLSGVSQDAYAEQLTRPLVGLAHALSDPEGRSLLVACESDAAPGMRGYMLAGNVQIVEDPAREAYGISTVEGAAALARVIDKTAFPLGAISVRKQLIARQPAPEIADVVSDMTDKQLKKLAARVGKPVITKDDWRHRAICQDEDPELFFPVGTSGAALLQIAEAKTVCRRCPVVTECLTWALESGQDAGVWGGMSEDERRALKRRNARTRARSA